MKNSIVENNKAFNTTQLTSNYQLNRKMDLKNDKKVNIAVQVLSI